MKPRVKVAAAASIAAVGAVLLSGCSFDKATRPFQDAPRSGRVNDGPADIVTNPDGFSNVASKCDNGNRVYVLYHGDDKYGSIAVVPQDPTCKGR